MKGSIADLYKENFTHCYNIFLEKRKIKSDPVLNFAFPLF